MPNSRKLIEVALPLQAINAAGAREKSIRHGHPSTLHLWWSRKPLAVARAVVFAQLVDDPGGYIRDEDEAGRERERLFGIIRDLVKWENTTNEKVLEAARKEIRASWERACEANREHPRAAELYDPERLPAFHDPFAGGGTIPLEAQRLGLEAHASDLNPVAVLINKAMIEIPPRFAGRAPVHPGVGSGKLPGAPKGKRRAGAKGWPGATGLAEDVRRYGGWMREEAARRIGHLYPEVEITRAMVGERPDLKQYEGESLTVIAWLWARTVGSPNPAFRGVRVPLASSFVLSSKRGKEAWVEPEIGEDGRSYRFRVRVGAPPLWAKKGTKLSRGANFRCLLSGAPMRGDYIKAEGQAKRMGSRLLAIVVAGKRSRVYLDPSEEHVRISDAARPSWGPSGDVPRRLTGGTCVPYGLSRWSDLFTPRQLVALTTFSDLVGEARDRIQRDAVAAELRDDGVPLRDGGAGATAYAEAVSVYMSFVVDKTSDSWNALATWMPRGTVRNLFARQAIPMMWDFAEASPFAKSHCSWDATMSWVAKSLDWLPEGGEGTTRQADAAGSSGAPCGVISTDPPYYDNIGYADLSDFFYVWLRRSLRSVFPDLFATLGVPKADELVATPYRHGGKDQAERFFLKGMTRAVRSLALQAHPNFPATIYYAFKQSERKSAAGVSSTGWETFLAAVIRSGFSVSGTWPMRTERGGRMTGIGTNALASSIIMVCRRRPEDAPEGTRREFVTELRAELPPALRLLQSGSIAPVDLQQAAIGPGMAVYTRYARVLDAAGNEVSVRDALALINEVLDEELARQEGDFDAESRWAVVWFEQHGFGDGDFGSAETLLKAKNTTLDGMQRAGIVESARGKVRLLRPAELGADVEPEAMRRTAWSALHHLIRAYDDGGTDAAGALVRQLGAAAETARDLCYRLFNACERTKRSKEALPYNTLVQSWQDIRTRAQEQERSERDRPGRLH